jgi:hypothetical protein
MQSFAQSVCFFAQCRDLAMGFVAAHNQMIAFAFDTDRGLRKPLAHG